MIRVEEGKKALKKGLSDVQIDWVRCRVNSNALNALESAGYQTVLSFKVSKVQAQYSHAPGFSLQPPHVTVTLSKVSVPTNSLAPKIKVGFILPSERAFCIFPGLKFLLSHLLFSLKYSCCFPITD